MLNVRYLSFCHLEKTEFFCSLEFVLCIPGIFGGGEEEIVGLEIVPSLCRYAAQSPGKQSSTQLRAWCSLKSGNDV